MEKTKSQSEMNRLHEEQEVIRMCAMCMSYIKTSQTVEYFTNCDQHNYVNGFEKDHECSERSNHEVC